MKLVKAEPLSVHVHQVSDVRHVQPRGGAWGLHRDHGGGKEGGHGGPHHWAQGLGAFRALIVVTIRRWGRHLKTSLGQTKTQSQQLSSTLAILRSLKHQIAKAAPRGLTPLCTLSGGSMIPLTDIDKTTKSVQSLNSHDVWRMRTVNVYSLPLSWVTVWGTRPGLGLGQHLRWLRRPRSALPLMCVR